MTDKLALLVVDVSAAWEKEIINRERGYKVEFDFLRKKYVRRPYNPDRLELKYPQGTARAGLDAIVETVRIANKQGLDIFAVYYHLFFCNGEKQPCDSILLYIPQDNIYGKNELSAFSSEKFVSRIQDELFTHLLILGYDRDDCVFASVKDAAMSRIKVITSESVMLTLNRASRREKSLDYFRANTLFLQNLEDVWDYIKNFNESSQMHLAS